MCPSQCHLFALNRPSIPSAPSSGPGASGGFLGEAWEVRLALAGPPCRLAPARCAWRQMRPPRPRPPPPLSPRSHAGGRSISSPSQEAAVSPFTSAVSGISSVVPGGREETSRSDTLHLVTAPRGLRAARGWAPRRTTALRTAGQGPGATETRPCTSSVGARTPRPPGPSAAPGSVSQPPSWGPLFLLPVAMFDPCHFPAPRILCCLVSPEHSRPRRPVLGHLCRSPSVPSRDPSPPPWLYLLRGRIGPESL